MAPVNGFRKYGFLFIAAGVVVVAYQLLKLLVQAFLPPFHAVTVIKGLLNLVHVRNPGGAFGFLSRADSPAVLPFFLFVTIATALAIIYFYGKLAPGGKFYRFALSFILGGALGNFIDRARQGQVLDFLDLHLGDYHWPAFNLADACITTGAVMLMLTLLRPRRG